MSQSLIRTMLRRESRSLMQYLREVPPWLGIADQQAGATLHLVASHEVMQLEEIGKLFQKHFHDMPHLGSFPDFTPYNDMALHFLAPRLVTEQKRLLADLERDRKAIDEPEIGNAVDRLIEQKQLTVRALEELRTSPHTFRTQNL